MGVNTLIFSEYVADKLLPVLVVEETVILILVESVIDSCFIYISYGNGRCYQRYGLFGLATGLKLLLGFVVQLLLVLASAAIEQMTCQF